jgi:hypothetical protein
MRSRGAPDKPVQSMMSVLQQSKHKIKTAYGTSTTTYGGSDREDEGLLPIQGIGQGNGSGPCSYACMSSIIVQAMKNQGYGATLVSA